MFCLLHVYGKLQTAKFDSKVGVCGYRFAVCCEHEAIYKKRSLLFECQRATIKNHYALQTKSVFYKSIWAFLALGVGVYISFSSEIRF